MKMIDRDWARMVWNHLHAEEVDTRNTLVKQYLGLQADVRDRLSDTGLALAMTLKDKYRDGVGLGLPVDDGWMIGPEYLLNNDLQLGHFEDSLVLAMIAARDPSNVVSLAAAARLTPRASERELLSEIVSGVGTESQHTEVRECVSYAADNDFRPAAVKDIQSVIRGKVQELRQGCFVELKQGLSGLLDNSVSPVEFVDKFFDLSEKTRIKLDVYSSMVQTLIRSSKVRPMVKLLMIENIMRMPKRVRYQVVAAVREMESDPENAYLRREMLHMLETTAAKTVDTKKIEPAPRRMTFLFN